jgi:predicted transcriptional regulator
MMATAVSPIKVDAETDRLLSDAAHFLGRSKKDVVDVAVRDYVDAHRDEINEGIRAALGRLDGSNASVVSLISGMSRDELDDLGGVPEA